ncbi:PPE domain-containing protein [Mycobacteroides salmoniphilum]|uniref:PPE domain-containing protein n=1 Tax=Mycobacteroides salmoniphilum TaxID=404941 RepID=UPI003569500C
MPHLWPAEPPELNHWLISTGDHAATLTGAGGAMAGLAGLMGVDASTMISNAAATAPVFVGLGGLKSLEAASMYTPLAGLTSAWVGEGAGLLDGLAAAHGVAENGMVPWPIALGTRTSAEGWAAANWHGFFTPIVTGLYEMYGNQWIVNGSMGSGYETAVHAAVGPLVLPGPFAPIMANPAGLAAEAGTVGATGAERASSVAMRKSFEGLQQAVTGSAGGPQAGGLQGMESIMQMFSGPMQMAQSIPQAFGSLPQTLGQFPQMGMGLLGPLLNGSALSAANPANALSAAQDAARQAAANGSLSGGSSPIAGLNAGPGSGGTAPMSSYNRPSASFGNPPGGRIAPAAGTGAGGPGAGGAGGGGGLFGAPGAAGRRGDSSGRNGNATPVSVTVDGERTDSGEDHGQ